MQRTIANALAAIAAGIALAPAASLAEPAPQQPQAPKTQLALATSDTSSQALAPLRLSASSLNYGSGVDVDNLRIELERAPQGIELEICNHEEVFSFVDATTYTFFQCQP